MPDRYVPVRVLLVTSLTGAYEKHRLPLWILFQWLCYSLWLFHLHSEVKNTAFFSGFSLGGIHG